MSEKFANRQREIMYGVRGRPILALEFDVFHPSKGDTVSVSMWGHTRHDIPFTLMKTAFEAIRDHIQGFIDDGAICPFNPEFMKGGSDES